jgi:hypothetical protein
MLHESIASPLMKALQSFVPQVTLELSIYFLSLALKVVQQEALDISTQSQPLCLQLLQVFQVLYLRPHLCLPPTLPVLLARHVQFVVLAQVEVT